MFYCLESADDVARVTSSWSARRGMVGVCALVAAASRTTIRAVVPEAERDHIQAIAAPLMPTLGATFAVLMALTLASEASYFAIRAGHRER